MCFSLGLCRGDSKSFRGAHDERRTRDAEGAEDGDAEGVDEVGNGYPAPHLIGSLGEGRKLPQRGPGQSPVKIDFTAF